MCRVSRAMWTAGATLLASLSIGGCLAGAAFGLADEPPDGLPPYGGIDPEEAAAVIVALEEDPRFVLLDIRTPAEVEAGHLPGAINIDFRGPTFEPEIDRLDRESIYLLYCRTANRTGQAFERMTEMGFTKVYDMQGGITLWEQLGYPVCEGALGDEHSCVGAYLPEEIGT